MGPSGGRIEKEDFLAENFPFDGIHHDVLS
jgi:hypothetical protein